MAFVRVEYRAPARAVLAGLPPDRRRSVEFDIEMFAHRIKPGQYQKDDETRAPLSGGGFAVIHIDDPEHLVIVVQLIVGL